MKNPNGWLVQFGITALAFLSTIAIAAIVLFVTADRWLPLLAPSTSPILGPVTLPPAGLNATFPSVSPSAPVIVATGGSQPTTKVKLGTTVASGDWQYTVTGVDKTKTLTWGRYKNEAQAKGVWLVVHIKLKNIGNQMSRIDAWDFEVLDNTLAIYDPSSLSFSYVAFKGLSQLGDQFPPGALLNTALVFDIGPDSRGLVLNSSQSATSVDLGQ